MSLNSYLLDTYDGENSELFISLRTGVLPKTIKEGSQREKIVSMGLRYRGLSYLRGILSFPVLLSGLGITQIMGYPKSLASS